MRVGRLHSVGLLHSDQFRNDELGNQSTYDINEEQTQKLLSQTYNVHPNKGDVEEIGEGDDKFVDEKFYDDTVLVSTVGEVLLVFCELFSERTINLLIEDVCYEHVNQVRNLSPTCLRVENSARFCPS